MDEKALQKMRDLNEVRENERVWTRFSASRCSLPVWDGDGPDPWKLLEMVEKANPPQVQKGDWISDVEFEKDGWRFEIFYDCGEVDYIDHFISPDGVRFEVWPNRGDMKPWQEIVSCWDGVGCLDRFLKENERL